MSSYLNIYLKPKGKEDMLLLDSFSRNTTIYSTFQEINPAFIGNGEEYNYSKVTIEDLDYLINDIRSDIEKYNERLNLYERSISYTPKMVDDIMTLKEMLKDAIYTRVTLEAYKSIVDSINMGVNDFESMHCNID